MKCTDCEYNGNCSVQEIAEDITGCEGHSKPIVEDGKCRCERCMKVFDLTDLNIFSTCA